MSNTADEPWVLADVVAGPHRGQTVGFISFDGVNVTCELPTSAEFSEPRPHVVIPMAALRPWVQVAGIQCNHDGSTRTTLLDGTVENRVVYEVLAPGRHRKVRAVSPGEVVRAVRSDPEFAEFSGQSFTVWYSGVLVAAVPESPAVRAARCVETGAQFFLPVPHSA